MGALSLPHAPSSAALARRSILADLTQANVEAGALQDVALVVSELVSNAVRHGTPIAGDGVDVGWDHRSDAVRLRVSDGGSPAAEPHLLRAGPHDTGGRGLAIVKTLSESWGVEHTDGITTVWARIPAPIDAPDAVGADNVAFGRRD